MNDISFNYQMKGRETAMKKQEVKQGKKQSKKNIYAAYGIEYKAGKILSPIGWINELLKEGNSKTGKAVYTFSVLAGNACHAFTSGEKTIIVKGTCSCNCVGCYAQSGFYVTSSVKRSLAINTYLVNNHIDFVKNAIMAQLEIMGRGEIRIHAAGDFNTANSDQYAQMWLDIVTAFPAFRFWTYTKVKKYETLFDHVKNANIVKSIIPEIGFNFGHCDYIINAYYSLKAMGKSVYICKCGINPEQHCEKCGVCATFDYVLFLEHSTEYKAENDPLYAKLCEIVNNQ